MLPARERSGVRGLVGGTSGGQPESWWPSSRSPAAQVDDSEEIDRRSADDWRVMIGSGAAPLLQYHWYGTAHNRREIERGVNCTTGVPTWYCHTRVQYQHYLKNDLKYEHSGATGTLAS